MPKSYRPIRENTVDWTVILFTAFSTAAFICMLVIFFLPLFLMQLSFFGKEFQIALVFGVCGIFGLIATVLLLILSKLGRKVEDSSEVSEFGALNSRLRVLTGQESRRLLRLLEIVAAIATIASCMISLFSFLLSKTP